MADRFIYRSPLVCLLFLVQPLATSQEKQTMEDARLEAFFKTYLDEEFRRQPLQATLQGDHRFDHLLDDVSAKARSRWTEETHKTLKDLERTISYVKLSRAGQIDFEILKHHLLTSIWLAENTRPFEEDPRVYNHYITDSVYLLLTQSTQPKPANIRNCAERMRQIPRIVAAAKESLKKASKVHTETAIKQTRGAIAFYEKEIFDLAGETPQLSTLRDVAKSTAEHLREYLKFLQEDVLPQATADWRLGKKKFAEKLKFELNSGIDSDDVLKEAEAEAVRVEHEMHVIARQLWSQVFPGQVMPQDDEAGKRLVITKVLAKISTEHGKPEDIVKDATATVARIKEFIKDRDILRLPEPDQCKIIEMPEFQRGNSIAYLNPAPPLDAKASSFYAISPPPREWDAKRVASYMQEYNRHMLQILTIHEAYPGHYVQLEYANRNRSLIRKVLYSGVFAEGWAVYTEQVMLDEGYGQGDLKLRLNQLKWYLRSVCNAILDFKMHCTGMTDQEALLFLMLTAYQSEAEAILKIIRAKQSSCQLSTYFVGRMAFQRLRRRVQADLGERFELGRFHEACLDFGTLPVRYLPELVAERLQRAR